MTPIVLRQAETRGVTGSEDNGPGETERVKLLDTRERFQYFQYR